MAARTFSLRWSELARLLFDVGAAVLMVLVLLRLADVRESQDDGKARGYATRATACRVQVALGLSLDESCREPEVVAYYDPTEQPTAGANSEGQQRNLRLLCAVVRNQGEAAPDCSAVP